MRVIDARSGKDVQVGDVIDYGVTPAIVGGQREWWKLLDVKDHVFTAQALVEYHQGDGTTWTRWSPLTVRFTHPAFMFQRVAFVPT